MTTEHQLQKKLTTQWLEHGLELDGERHFLAAWEVMDDFRINDAHLGFGRPAIDFLLLDSQGRMVAVELKLFVKSRRDSWAVLCQVTRRAALLAQAFTQPRLTSAHAASLSGRHGRVEPQAHVEDLLEAHARFFGSDTLASLPGLPVRRVVAARDFAPVWRETRDLFVTGPRTVIDGEIARYSQKGWPGTEFKCWLELPTPPGTQVAPDIMTLNIDH